jgi:hypothetical protein
MSSRRPRRPPVVAPLDPQSIDYRRALAFERVGWPSRQARRRFWARPDVPEALHPLAAPDPRELLRDDGPTEAQRDAHAAALEAFEAARLAWLEGAARG